MKMATSHKPKIKKSPHNKGQIIVNHKLIDYYISHLEIIGPNDFGETFEVAIGWTEPVKPMSMAKNRHSYMSVDFDSIMFEQ